MRLWKWVIGVVVVALVAYGAFAIWFNFIRDDAEDPFALDDTSTTVADPAGDATTEPTAPSDAPAAALDGTWTVGEGSEAGYRAQEIVFGQQGEATGRTTSVTGEMTIEGTTVTAASVTVDMASIESDEGLRDNQFRGRIMDVATYPTATVVLTEPIPLDPVPAVGEQRTFTATGELTLRGTTKTVEIPIDARRNAGNIELVGRLTIVFDEWSIPEPSGGPARVGDEGELEFHLYFVR